MGDKSRPDVWIGHVTLRTGDLDASEAFMKDIGMRSVFRGEDVAVLELRGGTHLVLLHDAEAAPADAGFDLMVEDLDAAHHDFRRRGYEVTDIQRDRIHDSFRVAEPGGNLLTFNSTHVENHALV